MFKKNIILTISLFGVLASGISEAATCFISPSSNTIQNIINTKTCDNIYLSAGSTWNERVDVTRDVTITSSSTNPATIQKPTIAFTDKPLFDVDSNIDLTLKNVILSTNRAQTGSAVYAPNQNTITIGTSSNPVIIRNQTNNNVITGSSIVYVNNGDLTVNSTTFETSERTAIKVEGTGSVTVENSTFDAISSSPTGSSLYIASAIHADTTGTVTVKNSTISDNLPECVGTVYAEKSSTVTISDNTFEGNQIFASSRSCYTNSSIAHAGTAVHLYAIQNSISILNNDFEFNGIIPDPYSSLKTTGGAVYIFLNAEGYASTNLDNNNFINNAADHGGALYYSSNGNTHSLTNSLTSSNNTYTDNEAYEQGGAAYLQGNPNTLNPITISNNTYNSNVVSIGVLPSTTRGGALYLINNYSSSGAPKGSVTINNSVFNNNNTYYTGGAIYGDENHLYLNDNTFTNNSVTNLSGGAIYSEGTHALYHSLNNHFDGNTANATLGDGGAVYFSGYDSFQSVQDSYINNSAKDGGAIFLGSNGSMEISNSSITDNSATANGGGIYFNSGNHDAEILLSTIYKNEITGSTTAAGQNIHMRTNVEVINSIIYSNVSGDDCNTGTYSVSDIGENIGSDTSCNLSNVLNPSLTPRIGAGQHPLYYEPSLTSFANGNADSTFCIGTNDLLGVSRWTSCDIGAVEN